ncbi:MAG TPA: hypothetical protein VEO00_03425 [Actinomycetota bacterium]|nr:hypothetical protein [Actinomycetota bacterium]
MRFDERARRATQGIHRAVEVMEMSNTKTPQRLTRFDQYRARMSRNQRIVAIAVGVGLPLLLLVGAVRLLGSDPDPTVPLAPSSTSVSPTPVRGRTALFEAPFTYTLPPGWTVSEELRAVELRPPEAPEGWRDFWVLGSLVPARSDCSPRPERGDGRSSDAMTSWLSTHPALDTTTPREVTLGGATGSWVDVQLADDADQTCLAGFTLLTGDPDWEGRWSIGAGEKIRFYVLDVPAGGTVTIAINPINATYFNDVIDLAAPVVESFKFLD